MPQLCEHVGIALFGVATRLKHPAFAEEKEWRIIWIPERHEGETGDNSLELHYRPGKLGIIPFVKLDLRVKSSPYKGKVPIAEAIHGPTEHPDVAKDALRSLLHRAGYGWSTLTLGTKAPLRV